MTRVEQDMVDRVDIEAVLGAFARCALTGEVTDLDSVLTEDAVVDANAIGGGDIGRADIAGWLAQAIAPFSLVVPIVGDVLVESDSRGTRERTAEVESTWHSVVVPADGGAPCIVYGLTRDRFVRSSGGWRIARRAVEVGIVVEMAAPAG